MQTPSPLWTSVATYEQRASGLEQGFPESQESRMEVNMWPPSLVGLKGLVRLEQCLEPKNSQEAIVIIIK